MKVYIATDHRGIDAENKIADYLNNKEVEVLRSTLPHYATDDYVDFAIDISEKVREDADSFGILICGTGIGMSIAANKVKGIRAARCVTKEDAFHTRNDNDANVLCISNQLEDNQMYEIIDTFLSTPFGQEERYIRRINKISNYEEGNNES